MIDQYTAPPTLSRFIASDARVRAVRGPVGSGKSTAMAVDMFRRAAQQAPGSDGIRRSRGIVVRNTLQQLRSTCLVTIQQLFRKVMSYKVSEQTIQIRAGNIHTDWILLPLDTPENIQRLLSLEGTFAWISEFREIDPEIAMAVLSRLGRYPSKMDGGPTWYGLMMETNSFSEDSPWYKQLELELPSNWDYFVQPGAMDPGAENRENLPPDYYEDLMESNTKEWVDQYVHNLIGESLSGQAVYRNTFTPKWHIAEKKIEVLPGNVLTIGMDFSRHPAAIFSQLDNLGRMRVLKELEHENMGVEKFVDTLLLPELQNPRWSRCPVVIVGDPSGGTLHESAEESVYDILKRLGFVAMPAITNRIDPRIRAVERFLLRQVGAGPAFMVDPVGCPQLIAGFKSHYRYRKRKQGELEDKPDKTMRPWADLHDALQYACLGAGTRMHGRIMARLQRGAGDYTSEPPKGAWT